MQNIFDNSQGIACLSKLYKKQSGKIVRDEKTEKGAES
jgi:hypothetical protein